MLIETARNIVEWVDKLHRIQRAHDTARMTNYNPNRYEQTLGILSPLEDVKLLRVGLEAMEAAAKNHLISLGVEDDAPKP